jgi:type IV pilus assembly protein PilY1
LVGDVPVDTDGDKTCDVVDTDDDNDTWSDTDETACGTSSIDDSDVPIDTDSDGVCDTADICPGGDDSVDSDGDGTPDFCEDDYGSTPSTAGIAVVDGAVTGEIEVEDDRDWFGVVLPVGEFQIDLEGSATSSGTLSDPFLFAYDSSGSTIVGSNYDGGTGLNSRLTLTVTTSGKYYFEARGVSSVGTYTLRIRTSPIVFLDGQHNDSGIHTIVRTLSSAMPTLSIAAASIMSFFSITEGEAEAVKPPTPPEPPPTPQNPQTTIRKVIFDALTQVVDGARPAVDFGAMAFGPSNVGGALLHDVADLRTVCSDNDSDSCNDAARDAFIAALPGVDDNGNNIGPDDAMPLDGAPRPLSSALYDAGFYFGAKYDSTTQYLTQYNEKQYTYGEGNCGYDHIVVLTIGQPNNDVLTSVAPTIGDADNDGYGEGPASEENNGAANYADGDHYLDDIAYRLHWGEDVNGDGEYGDITVHTVLAFFQDDELVQRTAVNGGGEYNTAYNAHELAKVLTDLLINIVLKADTAFVAPVVPASTTNRTISSDRVYLGLFKPQPDTAWFGNIKKYRVGTGETLIDRYGNNATQLDGDFEERSLSYWGAIDTDNDGKDDLLRCADTDRVLYNAGDTSALVTGDGGFAQCGGVGGTLSLRDLTDVTSGREPYTGKRSIFTYTNNSATMDLTHHPDNVFDTGNANLHMKDDGTPGPLAVVETNLTSSRTEENRVIKYVQGFEYVAEADPINDPLPQRRWPLGDILHSRPVVFNYSPYTSLAEETCYEDSSGGQFNSSVIYVGANDGMLHAFRDCDGRELWSFVPEQVLPYLKDGADGSHQYFVDSAPVAYVHDKDNDGIIEWDNGDRVVLVFGLRRGGSSDDIGSAGAWGGYFGIDVSRPYLATAPHSSGAPSSMSYGPQMVFSVDSSSGSDYEYMGQSWGQPRLGKVLDDTGDPIVVAFVPGGYSKHEDLRFGNNQNFPDDIDTKSVVPGITEDGGLDSVTDQGFTSSGSSPPDDWDGTAFAMRGRGMYALKIASLVDSGSGYEPNFSGAGTLAWKYDADDNDELDYPIASDMTAGDLDADGYIDTIYVGDTGGRMWRFAHPTFGSEQVSAWEGNIIFDSNNTEGMQGILPSAKYDVGRKIFYRPAVAMINGKPHIWFGTGDRAHPLNHAVVDRLYQVVDRGQATDDYIDEKNLVDMTEDPLQTGVEATVTETLEKLYNLVPGPNGESDYYHGWFIKMNWAFPEYDEDIAADDPAALSPDEGGVSYVVGEKVLAAPVMFNNEAYFTTYTQSPDPNANDPCAVGNLGSSHLYHLGALTGESVYNYDIFNDTNFDDPELNERAKGTSGVLTRADRTRYIGKGIPSGIVTLIDASGRVTMMISSSNRVDTYNAPDIKLIAPVYWMQW